MSAPHTRQGKHTELAHKIGDALLAAVLESRAVFPSCLNCAYAQEVQGPADQYDRRLFCTNFKGYPPPRVIVYACDRYADNEAIPF